MDRPNVGKQSKCVSINKLLGSEIESNIESEEKSKKKKMFSAFGNNKDLCTHIAEIYKIFPEILVEICLRITM